MNACMRTTARIAMAIVIGTSLLTACSGSSSTPAVSPTEGSAESELQDDEAAANNGNVSAVDTSNNSTENTANGASDSESDSATDDTSNGTAPDPEVQNTIRVDFEITVPAYASDSQQIELVWGAKSFYANWIGDLSWSATEVFPTDATLPLSVTFYDANGEIILGQYEQEFKTGTNASQIFTISANQFNSEQWDDDLDGVSNIEELRAGRNPLHDEALDLEVRESYRPARALNLLNQVSASYESSVPSQRPYNEQIDESMAPFGGGDPVTTKTVSIDIDSSGNGNYYDYWHRPYPSSNRYFETEEATRTKTADSVIWTGTYSRIAVGPGFREDIEFTTTTKMTAGQVTQSGSFIADGDGFADERDRPINIMYTLTGNVVSGMSECEPVIGNIVYESFFYMNNELVYSETTMSRNEDDQFWNVIVRTRNGLLLDEYLVPSIEATFHCEFGP